MSRSTWMMGAMVIAAVALLAPTAAFADKDEEQIPVKELPERVVTIVKAVCPGGEILSAEREIEEEDGEIEIEYEVKVKLQDGKIVEVEVVLDEDGNVKEIEIEQDDDDEEDDDDDDDD